MFGLGNKREIARQISEAVENELVIVKIVGHSYKHVNENGKRVPGIFYECSVSYNEEDTQ